MSIVLVKVYFKVYNDNERSKISIDSFVTRFLNRTSMCNCRTLSQTFLISCSIPKSFLVLLLINEKHAKALDVQTSETNSIRFFSFSRSRSRSFLLFLLFPLSLVLDLFPQNTFLSITYIEHMCVCAIYPVSLTSINMHFCSTTVVVDDKRKRRRRRKS